MKNRINSERRKQSTKERRLQFKKQSNKKMGFWGKSRSSSSKLLVFMIPLILVSVFIALISTNSSYDSAVYVSNSQINKTEDSSVSSPPLQIQDFEIHLPAVIDEEIFDNTTSIPPDIEESFLNTTSVPIFLNTTLIPPDISPTAYEFQPLPIIKKIQRKYITLDRLEAGLRRARVVITESKNESQMFDPDYVPTGPMYRNPIAFHRSYLEMEKQFKIFVYEEGEPPVFHNGPCKSIYAMEGNFIYQMESTNFRTMDPEKAHVFFIPISTSAIVHFVYERESHNWDPMKQTVRGYINLISTKYPYWNRSIGADHFMLACHDWGPELSASVPTLYKNSIRALCNANTSEGFNPAKDVSFPEILLPGGTMDGLLGGPSPSKRPILVFFAGGLHGPIRPILLEHWENKDKDVQIHKYLPKSVSYYSMLRKSKYCICPSGYEVASPRMVEALYTGCVPVLIKDHYVAPFSDVLEWKYFSVEIPVKDIPNLKKILEAISTRQYIRLQRRGKQVRRHFEVNLPPKRYDVFHMILHSVWLRRLNVRVHSVDEL